MSDTIPRPGDAGHNGDEYTPCTCDACKAGDEDLRAWAEYEVWHRAHPGASDEDYWLAKYPDAD